MTGRERVWRTLKFEGPDRAPRDLWALPAVMLAQKEEYEQLLEEFPLDLGKPYFSPGQSERASGSYERAGAYVDDWGSVWHVAEPGVIGEVKEPVLGDWAALATYQPPWELIETRDLSGLDADCETRDEFMLSDIAARPFERMQFLRGSENLLLDLAWLPREIYQLRDMVHEFHLKDLAQWCKTAVDGIFVMDDWGAQQSLLISPALWREFFRPLYQEYCDLIHAAGKAVFFHTDGHIEAIYGDLIEVGMDAINSQLFCMDIEGLAARYKGQVTFWGELDRQQTLPFGTPAEVKAAVARVRAALDDGRGGVIAQCEWGKNNPAANIRAMFEAWEG